jgi:hypothetical protein
MEHPVFTAKSYVAEFLNLSHLKKINGRCYLSGLLASLGAFRTKADSAPDSGGFEAPEQGRTFRMREEMRALARRGVASWYNKSSFVRE